jgi:hypothetical protein
MILEAARAVTSWWKAELFSKAVGARVEEKLDRAPVRRLLARIIC